MLNRSCYSWMWRWKILKEVTLTAYLYARLLVTKVTWYKRGWVVATCARYVPWSLDTQNNIHMFFSSLIIAIEIKLGSIAVYYLVYSLKVVWSNSVVTITVLSCNLMMDAINKGKHTHTSNSGLYRSGLCYHYTMGSKLGVQDISYCIVWFVLATSVRTSNNSYPFIS